jgi:hypothetical protein
MDKSSRAQAHLALKAAQATLSKGINCLRVASTACPPGPLAREGESLAHGMGGLPGGGERPRGAASLVFFPEGLVSGGLLHTILPSASTMDSFTFILGLESQVTSPLLLVQGKAYNGRYGGLLGGLPHGPPACSFEDPRSRGLGGGLFGNPQDVDGFKDACGFVTKAGGGTADCSRSNLRIFTTCQEQGGHTLYGPHNPGTQICGRVIARGAQGQFPNRFYLKTQCRFTTHATKSNLPRMVKGGYYVKENDTHGYSELCLLPEAAALVPKGLIQTPNSITAWKAIIR